MNEIKLRATALQEIESEYPFIVQVIGNVEGKLRFLSTRPFATGDRFVEIAEEWCSRYCAHPYIVGSECYIHFAHEEDAILFRMVFA